MKLWILSDMHADRGIDDIAVHAPDFDVFVCAGDVLTGDIAGSIEMTAAIARGKPAVFVMGNHEWMSSSDRDVVLDKAHAAAKRHRVHFLECNTVEIDGVRFAGTTFWTSGDARFPASVEFLLREKVDVVVTHFEPSPAAVTAVGAPFWICGHHHGFADATTPDGHRLIRNALGSALQVMPADEMPRQDFVVEITR